MVSEHFLHSSPPITRFRYFIDFEDTDSFWKKSNFRLSMETW